MAASSASSFAVGEIPVVESPSDFWSWIQSFGSKLNVVTREIALPAVSSRGQGGVAVTTHDTSLKARFEEDKVFADNTDMQFLLRRGCTLLEVGREKFFGRRGLPKFFDLDLPVLEGALRGDGIVMGGDPADITSGQLGRRINRAFHCGRKIQIYKTEKANGENAQVSFFRPLNAWVCCSKNVSLIARSPSDIETVTAYNDPTSAQRYMFASRIGRAWFTLLAGLSDQQVELVKETLTDRTLVGELVGVSERQHIVAYSGSDLLFYAVVEHKDASVRQCWAPSRTSELLQKAGVPEVAVRPFGDPCGGAESMGASLRSLFTEVGIGSLSDEGEGAVAYLVAVPSGGAGQGEEEVVVGVAKVKSLEYRFLRKTREKCKHFVTFTKKGKTTQELRREAERIQKAYERECKELQRECEKNGAEGLSTETAKQMSALVERHASVFQGCVQFLMERGPEMEHGFVDNNYLDFIRMAGFGHLVDSAVGGGGKEKQKEKAAMAGGGGTGTKKPPGVCVVLVAPPLLLRKSLVQRLQLGLGLDCLGAGENENGSSSASAAAAAASASARGTREDEDDCKGPAFFESFSKNALTTVAYPLEVTGKNALFVSHLGKKVVSAVKSAGELGTKILCVFIGNDDLGFSASLARASILIEAADAQRAKEGRGVAEGRNRGEAVGNEVEVASAGGTSADGDAMDGDDEETGDRGEEADMDCEFASVHSDAEGEEKTCWASSVARDVSSGVPVPSGPGPDASSAEGTLGSGALFLGHSPDGVATVGEGGGVGGASVSQLMEILRLGTAVCGDLGDVAVCGETPIFLEQMGKRESVLEKWAEAAAEAAASLQAEVAGKGCVSVLGLGGEMAIDEDESETIVVQIQAAVDALQEDPSRPPSRQGVAERPREKELETEAVMMAESNRYIEMKAPAGSLYVLCPIGLPGSGKSSVLQSFVKRLATGGEGAGAEVPAELEDFDGAAAVTVEKRRPGEGSFLSPPVSGFGGFGGPRSASGSSSSETRTVACPSLQAPFQGGLYVSSDGFQGSAIRQTRRSPDDIPQHEFRKLARQSAKRLETTVDGFVTRVCSRMAAFASRTLDKMESQSSVEALSQQPLQPPSFFLVVDKNHPPNGIEKAMKDVDGYRARIGDELAARAMILEIGTGKNEKRRFVRVRPEVSVVPFAVVLTPDAVEGGGAGGESWTSALYRPPGPCRDLRNSSIPGLRWLFPWSLDVTVECVARVTARRNHPTLEGPKAPNIALSFLQLYSRFPLGRESLLSRGFDQVVQVPTVKPHSGGDEAGAGGDFEKAFSVTPDAYSNWWEEMRRLVVECCSSLTPFEDNEQNRQRYLDIFRLVTGGEQSPDVRVPVLRSDVVKRQKSETCERFSSEMVRTTEVYDRTSKARMEEVVGRVGRLGGVSSLSDWDLRSVEREFQSEERGRRLVVLPSSVQEGGLKVPNRVHGGLNSVGHSPSPSEMALGEVGPRAGEGAGMRIPIYTGVSVEDSWRVGAQKLTGEISRLVERECGQETGRMVGECLDRMTWVGHLHVTSFFFGQSGRYQGSFEVQHARRLQASGKSFAVHVTHFVLVPGVALVAAVSPASLLSLVDPNSLFSAVDVFSEGEGDDGKSRRDREGIVAMPAGKMLHVTLKVNTPAFKPKNANDVLEAVRE
eukprot:Cvel_23737.t1-p1 / transcript=Cvel_23737.t1 / gene=Cvel_23737 / organism=Chromera_velia_CCMP2878 / gene_product=hypothetical protein / transcript_product=hypothetical protein / location=Cvel_scaffold2483:17945-27689(+) / protein_length=1648 / sequence_SO=supercontig / SO=protein_coding / is_pseudo=false